MKTIKDVKKWIAAEIFELDDQRDYLEKEDSARLAERIVAYAKLLCAIEGGGNEA